MQVDISQYGVTLKLSRQDTMMWATRPGKSWPCSTLAGHRFVACFDTNGLWEFTLDGKDNGKENESIDGHELSACCCDWLKNRLPKTHPCYDVVVGQFLEKETNE